MIEVPHNRAIQTLIADYVDWATEVVSTNDFLRSDYYEMVALPLSLLGEVPRILKFTLRAPGSISSARWMQRFLSSMKVILFKSQLIHMNVMSENDILDHEKLVLFLIMFYIRPWTEASLITLAPSNDLKLFKALTKFQYPAMKTMKKLCLVK